MSEVPISVPNAPVVSVVMAVFNGEQFLSCAILSVLNQTFKDFEFIIINDGSTDDTKKIVEEYTQLDSRIRLIHYGCSAGLPTRLNEAIRVSRGRYVARMDADDISHPERFFLQAELLDNQSDTDLVASSVLMIDENQKVLGKLVVPTQHEALTARPWRSFLMPHPSWMGRREWFVEHNYNERAIKAQDQDLLYRTYLVSRFAAISQPLLAYRYSHLSIRKTLLGRYYFLRAIFSGGRINDVLLSILLHGLAAARDLLVIGCGLDHFVIRRRVERIDDELNDIWLEQYTKYDNTPD